jgi:hypothetical protein
MISSCSFKDASANLIALSKLHAPPIKPAAWTNSQSGSPVTSFS